jgi:hypothetical protein
MKALTLSLNSDFRPKFTKRVTRLYVQGRITSSERDALVTLLDDFIERCDEVLSRPTGDIDDQEAEIDTLIASLGLTI